ncbi:MAG: hypothetical protein ACYTGB_15235, partial [Planctomycetota bacterium]
RRMIDKSRRQLEDLLREMRAHRIKPTGDLTAAKPVNQSLEKISGEHLPKVEKGIYLARTGADSGGELKAALTGVAREQQKLVGLLEGVLGSLKRSAITGAALHRAERILRDQIEVNTGSKPVLREGFGKQVAALPESVKRRLLSLATEERRIGEEVGVLRRELEDAAKSGPEEQRSGLRAAITIIREQKLQAGAARAAEQLTANNAAALTSGQELERNFKAVLKALQMAVAGHEALDPFELLGPSLAELAKKDKELAELLKKLQAMINEAKLLGKNPDRKELRKLQNMQDELNNMLVEVNRDIPEMDDAELIAKLKEALQEALAAMGQVGEAINDGESGEDILEELKVSLGHVNLAMAELKGLLATLAALQAAQQAAASDTGKETPAGIALGFGLQLGGNQTGETGPGGVLNPGKKAREFGRNDWGRLPPAVREQLMQAAKEKFPQEYEDLIELYFQNIAKGAK